MEELAAAAASFWRALMSKKFAMLVVCVWYVVGYLSIARLVNSRATKFRARVGREALRLPFGKPIRRHPSPPCSQAFD